MQFNSFQYAGFLALVVFLYWSLPRTGRKLVLLFASYAFYAWADIRFTAILFATSLIDYVLARELGRRQNPAARKLLLATSVGTNLVTLAFFKYFDWFREPVERVLTVLGFNDPHVALVVALPIGISFYTFSTLSYTIDVYRREIEPTRSLIDFMVFISYFPHLLAGPIIRAKRMLPQIRNLPLRPDLVQQREGLELIFIGLFQKVAVADALSPATAQVFSQFGDGTGSSGPGWANLWGATLAAVIQFTFDFAGYSNMARGSSKLLGLELPYNFRQPLTRSKNFRDFWRRDHMTMMAWFRDYLYRPLRGRRKGWAWTTMCMCLVFALSGLWHDDGLVWITWGFVMGGVVSAEIIISQRSDRLRRERRRVARETGQPVQEPKFRLPSWWPMVAPAYVFVMVAAQHAWVRTGSVPASLRLYGELIWPRFAPIDQNLFMLFAYAMVALLLLDRRERQIELRQGQKDPMTLGRALAYGTMLVLIVVFSGQAPVPFVYFQI